MDKEDHRGLTLLSYIFLGIVIASFFPDKKIGILVTYFWGLGFGAYVIQFYERGWTPKTKRLRSQNQVSS